MPKYYFSDDDEEMCYTIECHKQQMRDNEETERTVFEAIKSDEKDFFYCKAIGEIGAKPPEGDPCGKECIMYIPRNGISGCCMSYRTLYTSSDVSKVIKIEKYSCPNCQKIHDSYESAATCCY
jgi:hypothetical protein